MEEEKSDEIVRYSKEWDARNDDQTSLVRQFNYCFEVVTNRLAEKVYHLLNFSLSLSLLPFFLLNFCLIVYFNTPPSPRFDLNSLLSVIHIRRLETPRFFFPPPVLAVKGFLRPSYLLVNLHSSTDRKIPAP